MRARGGAAVSVSGPAVRAGVAEAAEAAGDGDEDGDGYGDNMDGFRGDACGTMAGTSTRAQYYNVTLDSYVTISRYGCLDEDNDGELDTWSGNLNTLEKGLGYWINLNFLPDDSLYHFSWGDDNIQKLVENENITIIYHLAAILSAKGEEKPELCELINVGGTKNILEAARKNKIRVFVPSSIAVFGPDAPKHAPHCSMFNFELVIVVF